MGSILMDNKIYRVLSEKDMSQAELARRVGVKREYMNRIINRRINPTIPLGLRISKALGVSVEDLFVINFNTGTNLP